MRLVVSAASGAAIERSLRRRTSRLAARTGEAAAGFGLGKARVREGGDHRLALRLREHAQPHSDLDRHEALVERGPPGTDGALGFRARTARKRWFASDAGVRTFSRNAFPRR